MKKLFAITTALALFLVACNSDNSSEQKKNQNKTETKSTKEKIIQQNEFRRQYTDKS